MHRLDFFVALNRPWQLIKTLKTKLWLGRLAQLTVGTWWIDMSHLERVFSCNFGFILHLKIYKEAITGKFACNWQNLLWMIKTWRYSILLSFMKIENYWWYLIYFSWLRNAQSSCNFLKVPLAVSVIIFSEIILHFAVYWLNNVSVSLWEKPKESNSEESIEFRVRTEWQLIRGVFRTQSNI